MHYEHICIWRASEVSETLLGVMSNAGEKENAARHRQKENFNHLHRTQLVWGQFSLGTLYGLLIATPVE